MLNVDDGELRNQLPSGGCCGRQRHRCVPALPGHDRLRPWPFDTSSRPFVRSCFFIPNARAVPSDTSTTRPGEPALDPGSDPRRVARRVADLDADPNGTSGLIPDQYLDPVATLAAVDDHSAGERILGQHLLRQRGKSMGTFAGINRPRGQQESVHQRER